MIDISVVSNNLSLYSRSADNLRRRRRWRWGGRRNSLPFPLDDASANVLVLMLYGRRRSLSALDVANDLGGGGPATNDGRLSDTLALNDSGPLSLELVLMLMVVVVVACRRDAPVPADNALLTDTNGAGASNAAVKGLDVPLAQNHLAGLCAAGIFAQECGCAINLTLAFAQADVYMGPAVLKFIDRLG
jgi:hypothetical protein